VKRFSLVCIDAAGYKKPSIKGGFMSNEFRGTGNLGQAPLLRQVSVEGEPRSVADLRVYFDRAVPTDDGYRDEGGFWLNVSLWGARAETAAKVLVKGARVEVTGQLRQESWEVDQGEPQVALRLTATSISIDPLCVESVNYRPRRHQEPPGESLPDEGPE
jgi:single-strand DNA-binding protein